MVAITGERSHRRDQPVFEYFDLVTIKPRLGGYRNRSVSGRRKTVRRSMVCSRGKMVGLSCSRSRRSVKEVLKITDIPHVSSRSYLFCHTRDSTFGYSILRRRQWRCCVEVATTQVTNRLRSTCEVFGALAAPEESEPRAVRKDCGRSPQENEDDPEIDDSHVRRRRAVTEGVTARAWTLLRRGSCFRRSP